MKLNEAFQFVMDNAGQLTDEQIQRMEFIAWSEGIERFVAVGNDFDDEGPQSYDEIRGV